MEKTLDPAMTEWLTFKEVSEGKSPRTVAKYRGYLEKLTAFLVEKEVEPLLVESSHLVEFTGIYLHREGLAPRSRRAAVAAVRGFYAWAVDNKHLVTDPASTLVYPKAGKPLPIPMGLSNAERLLMQPDISTLAGVRDAAIIALMMGCGFRVGGVCSMNEQQLIWFEYEGVQRLAIRVVEKGEKERMVPVPNEAMLLLQAYLGHPDLIEIDRLLDDGNQVLFVSLRNRQIPEHEYRGEARRLSTRAVDYFIKKYGEQAGLPAHEAHAHALRHLMGTELAEESATAFESQAILGHSDPKTTEIYTHLAMRKLTQVVDKANPLGKVNTPVSPLLQQMKQEGIL